MTAADGVLAQLYIPQTKEYNSGVSNPFARTLPTLITVGVAICAAVGYPLGVFAIAGASGRASGKVGKSTPASTLAPMRQDRFDGVTAPTLPAGWTTPVPAESAVQAGRHQGRAHRGATLRRRSLNQRRPPTSDRETHDGARP